MSREPNRRGRPALYPGQPMLQVGTRLPVPIHERLMDLSNRSGHPVHQLVREAVTRLVIQSRDR